MQDVRSKIDRPTPRAGAPTITVRDLRKDGERHFHIDRPTHAAVAPACLKFPHYQSIVARLAQFFSLRHQTPDEHLATQEIAAIRLRVKAEQELKEKLTHLSVTSTVGTWVTHEEIDALETRQRSLVALISRLRRERALISLIAMLVAIVGLIAHLGYQHSADSEKNAVTAPTQVESDAFQTANAVLTETSPVTDYDQFATVIIRPSEESAESTAAATEAIPASVLVTDYSPADFELLHDPTLGLAIPLEAIAPVANPERDVLTAANDWLAAWSQQDLEKYLAFYSKEFTTPRAMERAAWEDERRMRILRPSSIDVSLADQSISMESATRAKLVFTQRYRSNTYRDETSKMVDWIHEDGRWKILSESSLP